MNYTDQEEFRKIDGYREIKEYVSTIGFEENYWGFGNKNLSIYFNASFKQWRIRDTTNYSGMDITSISIPLDESEKQTIWRMCSRFYVQ